MRCICGSTLLKWKLLGLDPTDSVGEFYLSDTVWYSTGDCECNCDISTAIGFQSFLHRGSSAVLA